MSYTVFDQLSEAREPVSGEICKAIGNEVKFSGKILSFQIQFQNKNVKNKLGGEPVVKFLVYLYFAKQSEFGSFV